VCRLQNLVLADGALPHTMRIYFSILLAKLTKG
jgi:hypothetical protein